MAISRIAVFDFDGTFIRDLARYDDCDEDRDESLNRVYSDIEVDPERQRVYVTSERDPRLIAFSYDGGRSLFRRGARRAGRRRPGEKPPCRLQSRSARRRRVPHHERDDADVRRPLRRDHPASWPTEGLVQVWDEGRKQWKTAAFGLFFRSATNTYHLGRAGVTKLRYLPWSSLCRNFCTTEIEVRGR